MINFLTPGNNVPYCFGEDPKTQRAKEYNKRYLVDDLVIANFSLLD